VAIPSRKVCSATRVLAGASLATTVAVLRVPSIPHACLYPRTVAKQANCAAQAMQSGHIAPTAQASILSQANKKTTGPSAETAAPAIMTSICFQQ
jgi:hypothetical protein